MTRAINTLRKEKKTTPRFRINPIELAIFSTVVLVFLNSAYHLVEEGSELSLAALSPARERPSVQSRGPASLRSSVQQALTDTPVGCEAKLAPQTVLAPKTRLLGEVCLPRSTIGPSMPSYAERPAATPAFLEAEVKLLGAGHQAQVFVDPETGKFVTDYIGLAEGVNDLQITFKFQSSTPGKPIAETRVLKLTRK